MPAPPTAEDTGADVRALLEDTSVGAGCAIAALGMTAADRGGKIAAWICPHPCLAGGRGHRFARP
jgi:hypothetical protein